MYLWSAMRDIDTCTVADTSISSKSNTKLAVDMGSWGFLLGREPLWLDDHLSDARVAREVSHEQHRVRQVLWLDHELSIQIGPVSVHCGIHVTYRESITHQPGK